MVAGVRNTEVNHEHTRSKALVDRTHCVTATRQCRRSRSREVLFNLRHARLRNIIERTFGSLKFRFHILTGAGSHYHWDTQVKLLVALDALHNFVW